MNIPENFSDETNNISAHPHKYAVPMLHTVLECNVNAYAPSILYSIGAIFCESSIVFKYQWDLNLITQLDSIEFD